MPKFLDFTISSITQVWFAVSAPLHKSPVELAAIHFSIAASPPFLTSSQVLADTDLPFAQYSYSLYTTFLAAQLWRSGDSQELASPQRNDRPTLRHQKYQVWL